MQGMFVNVSLLYKTLGAKFLFTMWPIKIIRILKGCELAMSNSGKCKDNLNYRANYGPAEKNQPKF